MTHVDLVSMPVAEKIQLMEALWESLSMDDSVVPSWHAEVLAERVALLDQGQETVSDWNEAKQRIRNQVAGQ